MTTVLVAGASLAGLTAAEALRRSGYDGALVVVDPCFTLPPDRPPLSKQVLAGDWAPERAAATVAGRLPELDLDLRLGVAATGLDALTRTVRLSDGSQLDADGVVIASGASPRSLPGPQPDGVHVLRTMDDCLSLRGDLDAGPDRVAVIGAGFIGAEVAATCRGRGHEVTMIEAGPVPLGRVLPNAVGSFLTDLHLDEGVDVKVGLGVLAIEANSSGRVSSVTLADGSSVSADVVVVGIGVAPNTGWLEGSGLVLDDGVRCDETCLAAAGIVAAGDVASWPNVRYGEVMRVEQWENAVEQGEHAARRLLGELDGSGPGPAFAPVPWFWSDQYDRKIQMAGRPVGSDRIEIVEGSIAERRFVALFRREELCTGVLGVNRPRHVMQARMKMAESLAWGPVRELFG
jgi:3-phenylpropionate/trans-cinnamate dioxygenase ferredoxin reductase component